MKFFDELLYTKEAVEFDMWLYMELGARIVISMGAYPVVILQCRQPRFLCRVLNDKKNYGPVLTQIKRGVE